MKIVTKRLVLRDITKKDAEDIREHIDNKNVSQFLLVVPHPYTKKHAATFIAELEEENKKKPRKNYTLGIEEKISKEFIGIIALEKVDSFQGTARSGYWLAQPHWRKGYMSEAFSAIIDFAFTKLKLRRINIEAMPENAASNGLIKKMGFTHEGTGRKRVRSKATGKIHDEHFYGLLREEWLARKGKTHL